jgi:hypothetical protein
MRSISVGTRLAKSNSPLAWDGSFTRMPSIRTSVWRDSAPRIRTVVALPGPPASTIDIPGERRSTSVTLLGDSFAISSAVITVIALPARLIAC